MATMGRMLYHNGIYVIITVGDVIVHKLAASKFACGADSKPWPCCILAQKLTAKVTEIGMMHLPKILKHRAAQVESSFPPPVHRKTDQDVFTTQTNLAPVLY